ncbi:hypothetical protein [Deinococcus sedimenti]|nr:hypothetical protein [Deinococcus sedimenti]
MERFTLTVTRARVSSAGHVLRPGRPHPITVLDYGNGTFELEDGSCFQSVSGHWATRDALVPGATFFVGKNDEYLYTVTSGSPVSAPRPPTELDGR